MKLTYTAVALAVASASLFAASAAQASQADSKGFVEDSTLNLLSRNLYWDMDRHDTGWTDNREWGQGFQLDYVSGFTQGTLGFGIDVSAYGGIKLDSGGGRGGSKMFPIDSNGDSEDDFSSLGGAVKVQLSNTVLKYGDLRPYNPVIALADARLVPATATGFQLNSAELKGLKVDAGHFTSSKDNNQSGSHYGFHSSYGNRFTEGGSVDFLGATYAFTDALSVTAYASRYEDMWKQYYGNGNYVWALNDNQSLSFDFNLYRSLDEGKALLGDIDTTAWSFATGYSIGAHTITLAYQKIHGDQPFDYLSLGSDKRLGVAQDSIYLANSMQLVDFNGPQERSWRLGYNLNMATYGVPGLTFYAGYTKGDNVEGDRIERGSVYDYYADSEKHWERDLSVKYVVQSGPAKDLSFRVRQATHRISGISDSDSDQVRLIIEYPLSIL